MSLDEMAPNVTSSSDEVDYGSDTFNRKLVSSSRVYSGNNQRI